MPLPTEEESTYAKSHAKHMMYLNQKREKEALAEGDLVKAEHHNGQHRAMQTLYDISNLYIRHFEGKDDVPRK